jgi:DNA polymerase elongation subunit (family B)
MSLANDNPELHEMLQQATNRNLTELVLDIETEPIPDLPQSLLDELYGKIEPTQTAIKANKVEEYIENKQKEIQQDFALYPMTGKILGIGLLLPEKGTATYIEEDEPTMLSYLNDLFSRRPPRLITFNGKNFDIPYLKIRSAILGIKLYPISTKRYDTSLHFDVREVLTNFGANQKGTLKQWAIVFGQEPQKDSGKDIHLLTKEERQEKCLADCRITNSMFQRLKTLF